MDNELSRLIDLTERLTRDGYLKDQTDEWGCILDAIPECIYITNINKYIKFINKTLQIRLNVAIKDEVYDKTCFSLLGDEECLHSKDKTDFDLVEWCNTPEIVFLSGLDGWYESSTAPIYSKTGRFLGYICVLRDVTGIKKRS